MIKSFADKHTRRLFEHKIVSRFPPEIQRKALMKLYLLDAAETLADLRVPPGNRLEKLTGDASDGRQVMPTMLKSSIIIANS